MTVGLAVDSDLAKRRVIDPHGSFAQVENPLRFLLVRFDVI
jgi:hypothetical protein